MGNSSEAIGFTAKERAEQVINEAALKAHYAKNTDCYEELSEDLYMVLIVEYAKYLNAIIPNAGSFICLKEGQDDPSAKSKELMSDMYNCSVDKKFVLTLLKKFDPDKNYKSSFLSYFHAAVKEKLKITQNEEKESQRVKGLTGIYSDKKRDPQLSKRYQNYLDSAGNEYCNSNYKAIKAYCEEAGESEEKLIQILLARDGSLVEFSSESNGDDENEDISGFDCYAFGQYIIQETENEKTKFECILQKINEIFSENKLNDKEKKIYSAWFTSRLIKSMVEEAQATINKYISLDDTLKNHFEYVNLNVKKELYSGGKYLCIYPEVFDYVTEHRKLVSQKEIAEFFECKSPYVNKVVNKINEMLKQDF